LIARQAVPKFDCYYAIGKIRKATEFDIEIPINTIFTKFTIDCNITSISVAVTKYSLKKFNTNGQQVGMKGVSIKQLGGVPENIGPFIIGSYLLSADPAEMS
jgi:hypothetical protein